MPSAILVVGYGSIGSRHARIAQTLGHDVSVVSRRPGVFDGRTFDTLDAALKNSAFDAVILANETSAHWNTLQTLVAADFQGRVLVEKPLSAQPPPLDDIRALGPLAGRISVGFNLRFHPVLQRVKDLVGDRPVINAVLYAGQDLRSWRPQQNVDASYSSSLALGGGVLRDLSHEFDYLQWLLGGWVDLIARGGRLGAITVDADDCWGVMLSTQRCRLASVQIDYFNRPGARFAVINTADDTITANLVAGTVTSLAGAETFESERDTTYIRQLDALLGDDVGLLCTLEEALAVMAIIDAAEQSARDGRLVRRAT